MLHELADESKNQGQNKSKTKMMMENDTPIYVNNTQIENGECYIYMGKEFESSSSLVWLVPSFDLLVELSSKFQERSGTCKSWRDRILIGC